MGIKRNCSASLSILIEKKPEDIALVEIVFKKEPDPKAEELLKISYNKEEHPKKFVGAYDADELVDNIINGTAEIKYTSVACELKPEHTYKLCAGTIYADVRVVLTDGFVVPTDMFTIEDVAETLFNEVYSG